MVTVDHSLVNDSTTIRPGDLIRFQAVVGAVEADGTIIVGVINEDKSVGSVIIPARATELVEILSRTFDIDEQVMTYHGRGIIKAIDNAHAFVVFPGSGPSVYPFHEIQRLKPRRETLSAA